ncbi:MAG: hypothetical protein AAF222_04600 [Pseudomonadota bacterium]
MIARCLRAALAVLLTAGAATAACPTDADHKVDIYPTAAELPENLLRMYLYFPRAMAATEGMDSVTLLDDQGQRVNGAFLATNQELWSPDRSRLTLLLDPGRVKSGLAAHELMGRALVPGRHYTLVISGAALDAQGCALGHDSLHSFSVIEADLDTPAPARWSLTAPRLGGTDPVRVDLGSTHDHLSMAYRLRVLDDASQVVPGAIALGPDETSWAFTPRSPWRDTTYTLAVDERLEDLAGNRPGILFDRPVSEPLGQWKSDLPFRPRAPQN